MHGATRFQVHGVRGPVPCPPRVRVAEAGRQHFPRGGAKVHPGQGHPRPDLLCPRGPQLLLRRPVRPGGQEQGRGVPRVAD